MFFSNLMFYTRYADILTKAFTVYARTLLYTISVLWSSYLAGLIDIKEGVQRAFKNKTKRRWTPVVYVSSQNSEHCRTCIPKIKADLILYILQICLRSY